MTSDEKDENENFEESIEQKILNGQSLDSGEEIRAKLLEYKRRLADHEYRKKQREKVAALTKELDSTPSQVKLCSISNLFICPIITILQLCSSHFINRIWTLKKSSRRWHL